MKRQIKITGENVDSEAHSHALGHQASKHTAREFASAEDMLRHDASQTAVPPGVARRLQHSLDSSPGPATAWWKRWLGR